MVWMLYLPEDCCWVAVLSVEVGPRCNMQRAEQVALLQVRPATDGQSTSFASGLAQGRWRDGSADTQHNIGRKSSGFSW